MLEPKTCKYILTIESPSLCELINGPMDEYGIFNIESNSDIKDEPSILLKPQTEDTTELHFEEDTQKTNTVSVEQETEVTNDKKKMGKIEL